MFVCSICGRMVNEYGNNAWPVNDGRCCEECDWKYVIPARMARMDRARKDGQEE